MSKRTRSPVDVPIPRTAVLWLLGSQLLSLWLHATHLPLWLWAVVAFVLGWRWLTHLGRVSYPDRRIKTLAVIAASVAVFMAFERRLTLESASAFLIAASSLKLLEMKVRRDGYVVGYLSFFVLGTGFLFDQGILSGLFGILAVWCLTTALVTLHGQDSATSGQANSLRRSSLQAGRLAGGILLVSLPMMLVLYLLFPRMGPLWSFTLQSGKAKSGLSEEMASGDIVDLSQSDELAFRVSFTNGQLPAREQLYWRALVLDYYDGRRWLRQSGAPQVSWFNPANPPAPAASHQLEYEIVQEATDKNWLFALTGVNAAEPGTGHTSDNRLVARRPVFQRQRYLARSDLQARFSPAGLSAQEQQSSLQLPGDFNPQARAFARQLRRQHADDRQLLAALLQHFRDQPFYYTLQPPPMATDEVDDFLFNARRGFCAHYAGALVFVARAAGIPARVVTGYQGGEWNESEQYLTVRQFDAHAWAEVWLPGEGWVQTDPTAAVAPDRIQYGLEQAVAEEGSFLQEQLFSAHKLKGISWLNRLRLELDSLNYYWQRWVLSYDRQSQRGFLQNLLGLREYQQALYWLAGSFVAFFALASLWLWWRLRPQPPSPFMQAWQRLQQRGQRLGVVMAPGETAAHYCQRLAQACPAQRSLLLWLGQEVNSVLYQPVADTARQRQRLRQLIRALHRVRRQLPGQAQKQPLPATLAKGP